MQKKSHRRGSSWTTRQSNTRQRVFVRPLMESLEARRLMAVDTLQLLHASDLEGGVDAIEDAPNFAAVVEALEADAASRNIPSLLISAGDSYIPGPFFGAAGDGSLRGVLQDTYDAYFGLPSGSLDNIREGVGRVDVTIMNLLGVDASALGNHEFDAGTSTLSEIIGTDIRGNTLGDVRWLGAQFPFLSANLDFSGDGSLSGLFTSDILPTTSFESTPADLTAAANAPKLANAATVEISDGVDTERVGIVAATTPLLEQISSPGDTEVKGPGAGTNDMDELAAILQPIIDDVIDGDDDTLGTADDVHKVILTTHLQQLALEQQLVPLLSGVDIAIAGGSDTLLADGNDRLRAGDSAGGSYPVLTTNKDGDPAVIVSTDGQYSYVGRLIVGFQPGTGIVDASSVTPETAGDVNVNGAYPTDEQGVIELWGNLTDPFAPGTKGAAVRTVTDAVSQVVLAKDSQTYGSTSVFLEGRRSAVRTQETNLGNLTADANLAAAQQVDPAVAVSIKNGGGIRAEIGAIDGITGELLPPQANPQSGKLEGQISQLDIENSLRFNNELTLLTLTAEELVEVIEHGVAATAPGATPGRFPQVGGVRFSFDPRLAPGDRVQSLAIVDDAGNVVDTVVENGHVVGDPDRPIRIVTLNFLAGGGDGYPFPPTGRLDTGIGEQQALADFLADNYVGSPYARSETPAHEDTRIQNLQLRGDTVLTRPAIALSPIGTYATGVFDESAAEIVAHDPASQRVFFTNSDDDTIGVLDIQDPTQPTLINTIDLSTLNVPGLGLVTTGGPNSVSVSDGLVAVAVENAVGDQPGFVAFYDVDGNLINAVIAGVLPDALTFSPDGNLVLVANEGEPTASSDPPGSISIIDVSGGAASLTQADVTDVDFAPFNGQEQALRNKGVRIFPGKSAGVDLEPEYITVSPDGTTALATLQEANAVAVVDLTTNSLVDIVPLGLKDHGAGLPQLTNYDFDDRPDLGTTATGEVIQLGGFSGITFDGMTPDGNYRFLTVPDRGPNGDNVGGQRPFLLPDYQARVVEFELNPQTGQIQITDTILLTRDDPSMPGQLLPITGLPNLVGVDEVPVDAAGNPVSYDPFGADLEGIVRDPADGSFWMVDEYRPAIYHFGTDGVLINRFIPDGTAAQVGGAPGDFGEETLPADYLNRRPNRGFEAVAFDTDRNLVFAFIQTPLSNPDRAAGNNSNVIRVLGIDPATGAPVEEYVYLLEKPVLGGNVDKIGDAVYAGDGKFFVLERDSGLDATDFKFVFEMNLKGATDVLGQTFGGQTLEQQTADSLAALGIQPVGKRKVTNLASLGYLPSDKPEGLTLLPDGRLAVLNDNDFGLVPGAEPVQLGIVSFRPAGLDASDRDDAIWINDWPVFGMFMPDAISSFEVDGQTYYVTANEGDARDADDRVKNLALDPTVFPNAAQLQADEMLGRLEVSTIDGDFDGDGDYDALFAYGSRSFTIWDANGNLVYDSGEDFEQFTAARIPAWFNSTNDEAEFDSRSDAKGPEPEAVTTGVIDGRTYAFVGLERIGGIMVYDVSVPTHPTFIQYINNRDFTVDQETAAAGDLGVEDLKFVTAADSPNGKPLLIAGNEVSGTVTIFQIDDLHPTIETDFRGDSLTLRRDGDNLVVTSDRTGDVLLDQPLSSVHSLTIKGQDYRRDQLTVDLSAGDITIPGGIHFDGGERSFGYTRRDTLVVIGTAEANGVTLTDDRLSADGLDIHYQEVEYIEVELGEGDDTVAIEGTDALTTLSDGGGDDTLNFANAPRGIRVYLRMDRGQLQNTGVGRIGLDGDFERVIGSDYGDRILGSGSDNVLLGGEGRDFLYGIGGNNVLVGGDDNDYLYGGRDDDILIGGLDRDLIFGFSGSDLLIGGTTDHDQNVQALLAIRAEWTSGTPLPVRRQNLEEGGGLNGNFRLKRDETVQDDAARDLLFSGRDDDWLIDFPGDFGF